MGIDNNNLFCQKIVVIMTIGKGYRPYDNKT